jgi:hypothetical protein
LIQKPQAVSTGESVTRMGKIFGTEVVVKGITWLPLTELVVWGIMAWQAGRKHPERSWKTRLKIGAMTMPVILGSEWGHNLAHAVAAYLIGKPMDALRIVWGMPLVVYYDINDEEVNPDQHIFRALGGPIFNALLVPVCFWFRKTTNQGSVEREVSDAALGMNLFLSSVSLLPIPGIDGGPILRWTLVRRGDSLTEADEIVKQVNRACGAGLGVGAVVAIKRKRRFIGLIMAMLSATALAVGWGLLKE